MKSLSSQDEHSAGIELTGVDVTKLVEINA